MNPLGTLGTLHPDIRNIELIRHLPTRDLLHYCRTNTRLYQICQDPKTWHYLLRRDYQLNYQGPFPDKIYRVVDQYHYRFGIVSEFDRKVAKLITYTTTRLTPVLETINRIVPLRSINSGSVRGYYTFQDNVMNIELSYQPDDHRVEMTIKERFFYRGDSYQIYYVTIYTPFDTLLEVLPILQKIIETYHSYDLEKLALGRSMTPIRDVLAPLITALNIRPVLEVYTPRVLVLQSVDKSNRIEMEWRGP